MNAPEKLDMARCKEELSAFAIKSGAVVTGVADAEAFTDAPEGHRPTDLLPRAKSVFVVGGAKPRAGDWMSPNYQHMEMTSTSDRIFSLSLKLAHFLEDRFGYYAVCVPPGVDQGNQSFLSLMQAAELAGCGSPSLAGPVLNREHGFMYYAAIVTTLPLPPDGPTDPPACPAPECVEMWKAEGTTPCLNVCPIGNGGCLGGRIEDGRVVERQYDRARCTTRVQTHWVPGFQKVLEATLQESDTEQQKMMLYSTSFTRSLWSMTYSNISQGQCAECMRVCPVAHGHKAYR